MVCLMDGDDSWKSTGIADGWWALCGQRCRSHACLHVSTSKKVTWEGIMVQVNWTEIATVEVLKEKEKDHGHGSTTRRYHQ